MCEMITQQLQCGIIIPVVLNFIPFSYGDPRTANDHTQPSQPMRLRPFSDSAQYSADAYATGHQIREQPTYEFLYIVSNKRVKLETVVAYENRRKTHHRCGDFNRPPPVSF